MRLAHKIGVIAGAWSAVAVAASMAAVRAVYVTLEEVKGEPPLSDAPPKTWRWGDIVREVGTHNLVEIWAVNPGATEFMDSAGTIYDTKDYVLFKLNEEEA